MRSLRVGHRESRFSSHADGSLISCSDWVHLQRQTLAYRPQPEARSLPHCPSAWWVNSAAGSSGPGTHKEKPELHTSFHSGRMVCHEMVTHNTSNTDKHLANTTESRMGLARTGDTHHTNTNTYLAKTTLRRTGMPGAGYTHTHTPTQTRRSPTSC